MDRYVIKCTFAPSGTGKTWRRAAKFVVDEWIPYGGSGVHWSNFPWRLDPYKNERGKIEEGLVKYCARRHKVAEDEVRRRVRVIPAETLEAWRDGISGPWEFFADEDLSGAHIAIDEAQTYWPSARVPGGPEQVDRLMHWLATIRHTGATVEFITQAPDQIHQRIKDAAGGEFVLTNIRDYPIPFIKVRLGDLFDLVEVFTGVYPTWVRQDEYMRSGANMSQINSDLSYMDPHYFRFYDSHARPATGGQSGKSMERAVQRIGRLRTLQYFAKRYSLRLVMCGAALWGVWYTVDEGRGIKALWSFGDQIEAAVRGQNVVKSEGDDAAVRQSSTIKNDRRLDELSDDARERLVEVVMMAQAAKAEADRVRAELEKLEAENVQLREQVAAAGAVVLVTPTGATFHGGEHYNVGDVIKFGPFAGDRIEKVDYGERAVLVAGRWLRLSSAGPESVAGLPVVPVITTEPSESNTGSDGVSGSLPIAEKPLRSVVVGGGQPSSTADVERAPNATTAIRPVGEQPSRSVGDLRGRVTR